MAKTKKTVKKKAETATQERNRMLLWSIMIPLFVVTIIGVMLWRTDLSYTLKSWMYGEDRGDRHSANEHDRRNLDLMRKHDGYVYGIDISQYQGKVRWIEVNTIHDQIPVDFVFIRATMGERAKDKRYGENWRAASSRAKLRGAYHYFRPNENSIRQARNFIQTVDLKPGDLPPVLDIEERPRRQPMDSLKVGLKRWLDEVEAHYGIQPILYSGDSYFTDFLEKEFSDYILWIANYNFWIKKPKKHWNFWQFSERGYVRGIQGNVDLNMFKGSIEDLEGLAIPY
ncbi:GH25 family lysozyme [Sphingobacterium suaedae]|uniref:GH25 family lysozyme n=1 Tax=Sphingobacterium suaedae TaxID=1686402 RepID=A0ABW5KEP6_9SPHI